MVTLTDISSDGHLEARYLNDRRGVLMRAKYTEQLLLQHDFEAFTATNFGAVTVTPQVRSSATIAGSGTSFAVPMPSGWQAGDLVYIAHSMLSSAPAVTTPSGWSQRETKASGSNANEVLTIFKREMQAGDPSTVTITCATGRHAFISLAMFDYEQGAAEDCPGNGDTNAGVTGASVRAPSVTTVRDTALLLTFHAVRNGTSGVTDMSYTPPPGMTEVADIASTGGSTNTALTVAKLALTSAGATGTKNATLAGSNISTIDRVGITLAVRPKGQVAGLPMAGGFAWKNISMPGPHEIIYDVPGSSAVPIQWCGMVFKGADLPVTVDAAVSQVISATGAGTTATFNVAANSMIVALVGYNADFGDAAGTKITITNNKGLTVTHAVERAHLEAGTRGGCAIAYMPSVGAQTGMTVTATITGVDSSRDDLVLKVLVLGNVDLASPNPQGPVEGTPTANIHRLKLTAQTNTALGVWAITDADTTGSPVITEDAWTAIYGTVAKTATSPIMGQSSLLNTWTSNQMGVKLTLPTVYAITGPRGVRVSFKIVGTEGLASNWPTKSMARLEVSAYGKSGKFATNTLGFPGTTVRSWSTEFFIPTGNDLRRIDIVGYGWDTSAAARIDEFTIVEIAPTAVLFSRKTDGGFVRGGHPAACVSGTAYAFDDELVPNQFTEWHAEPIYADGRTGAPTGAVGFTTEDRATTIPSTMIKSVETPGLVLYLATDQHDFTRSRSTTFVNKQTTGKPAGGVNSAYSASGDYMLITQTIPEMREFQRLLDETILYISPTGRFNRDPFYATVSEYTIIDFAQMSGEHKIFNVRFQEVERPDTEWSPSFLPLADYSVLPGQYTTYDDPDLTSMTYDELAFSAVT